MPSEREQRRRRILEIVEAKELRTQEELAEALASDGWPATQSSVSRDIAALRLVKLDGVYRRPPRPPRPRDDPDERRVAEAVVSARPSGSALVVLRTPAGEANHVAVGLDRLAWPEVVGTLAGDDTIFVAVRDAKTQRNLIARLKRLAEI